METGDNSTTRALCRAEPSPPGESCRPWSHEDNLWLRILKTPEEHLRPCDWSFIDTRLGRPRREVRRQLITLGLANFGRRYSVNEAFFETWSRESAWVVGLLMADGHLSSTQSTLHFSSVDRDLVEKLRACMGATHIREGIDALVCGRLKSERVRLPDIPTEFLGDFVRGYFEGDGSIFLDESRNSLQVQISGLTAFIKHLRMRLVDEGVIQSASVYRCRQARDTSTFTVSAAQGFYVAHFMYRDAPPALRLERKRAAYGRALESRLARGLSLEAPRVG